MKAMKLERLEELKLEVKFMAKSCIEHGLEPDYVDTPAEVCELIDAEIERQKNGWTIPEFTRLDILAEQASIPED